MKWVRKILKGVSRSDSGGPSANQLSRQEKQEKIEKGAKDFAIRFEDVMRDLAKS